MISQIRKKMIEDRMMTLICRSPCQQVHPPQGKENQDDPPERRRFVATFVVVRCRHDRARARAHCLLPQCLSRRAPPPLLLLTERACSERMGGAKEGEVQQERGANDISCNSQPARRRPRRARRITQTLLLARRQTVFAGTGGRLSSS